MLDTDSRPAGFPPPTGARAGWYPDPYGQPYARYYDGYRWTAHIAHDARRPAPAPEEHPVLPFPVVVGAVAILAGSLIGSNQLLDSLLERRWPVVAYMALAVAASYGPPALWMWFASRRWGSGRLLADLGVRFRWVDLGWGPLIWVSTIVAMGITLRLIETFDVPYRGNLEGGSPVGDDKTAIAALIVAAVVFAPVIEEALFRGMMMRGLLSKMPAPAAIGLQAVVFGAAHVQPAFGRDNLGLVIVLAVAGAGFGLGCFLVRRLGPVMIAHAVLNGVAITVLLTR